MKSIISTLALPLFFFMTALAPAAPAVNPGAGAAAFKAKCAVCHGQDGSANTPMGARMKIRDLRSPEVQGQTDDQLAAIITNGKPPMPAYGKSVTAKDIQQLVAYIRSIATKS